MVKFETIVPALGDNRASRKYISDTENRIFRAVKTELRDWRDDVKGLYRSDSLTTVMFGAKRKFEARVIQRQYGTAPKLLKQFSDELGTLIRATRASKLDRISDFVTYTAMDAIAEMGYADTQYEIWFDIYQNDTLVHAYKVLFLELQSEVRIEIEAQESLETQRLFAEWHKAGPERRAELSEILF